MRTKILLISGCNVRAGMVAVMARLRLFVPKMLILVCLLLLLGCQGQNQGASNPAEVRVARVVSGNTLQVLGLSDQPNLVSTVRLIGIDAPDVDHRPWGEKGKDVMEGLIGSEKTVLLEFDLEAKDKFGRTLAYVWRGERLLNEEIVKEGYALFIARSPNHKYDDRLERSQQWARLMGQGIWNPEKPMRTTPADFRRLNR